MREGGGGERVGVEGGGKGYQKRGGCVKGV